MSVLLTDRQIIELQEREQRFARALRYISGYSVRHHVKRPNGSTLVIERVAEAALAGQSIEEAAKRGR